MSPSQSPPHSPPQSPPHSPHQSTFITLDRESSDFQRYLLGQLPNGRMAIPVNSLHVSSNQEKVTFQILNQRDILRPSIWIVISRLMRIDLIAFTLLPVIAIFAQAVGRGEFPHYAELTLLSLFFLHGAVFCRNDFIDHINGIDRVNEKGGSRAIQNGWIRAINVQRLYRAFIFASIFFAGPILLHMPALISYAILGGGIGLLGYSILRQGRFGWLAGQLAVFMALGPLLTIAANLIAGHPLRMVESLLVGTGFGLAALAYLEIRHLISVVVDDTSGLRTLAVSFGFDRAKQTVAILFIATAIALSLFILPYHPPWGAVTSAAFLALMTFMFFRVKRVSSPLSSLLQDVLRETIAIHALYGVIVVAFAFCSK